MKKIDTCWEGYMERIAYKGWKNCYYLFNGCLELVVTADVGPRVLRFGFVGDDNEFYEYEEYLGMTGGDAWRNYGGHRLWHAPELYPRTYAPDNGPVTVEEDGNWTRFVQLIEPLTGIQKEIKLRLYPDEAHVEVVHRLRNTQLWAVTLAPWALSVVAQGGTAILPLPPRAQHGGNLLPTSTLALWAYTDMADPRWTWGTQTVLLRQDVTAQAPQKIGAAVPDGWVAYARGGHLFLKTFEYWVGERYPDLGCAVELYTDDRILEVETLGPLTTLAPGAVVEHVEHWFLFPDVPMPSGDAEVAQNVMPHVRACRSV